MVNIVGPRCSIRRQWPHLPRQTLSRCRLPCSRRAPEPDLNCRARRASRCRVRVAQYPEGARLPAVRREIYLFIGSLFVLIAVGLVRVLVLHDAAATGVPRSAVPAGQAVGVLLILKAFSSGCTAMTGIEAVHPGPGQLHPTSLRPARACSSGSRARSPSALSRARAREASCSPRRSPGWRQTRCYQVPRSNSALGACDWSS
jgi:hypothetical protein